VVIGIAQRAQGHLVVGARGQVVNHHVDVGILRFAGGARGGI
jgi:hypothetical protein